MERSESPTPTHVVVVDQDGRPTQTLELPPGVPFNELEFIAVSKDGTHAIHLPTSTALTLGDTFDPPRLLPLPDEKVQKELFLAKLVAPVIQRLYGLATPLDLSTNPDDPPDVLATAETRRIGIELCELVYRERYGNDRQFERVRQAVRRMGLGASLTEHQILFALRPTPEGPLQLPPKRNLERALRELFALLDDVRGIACIPGASVFLREHELPASCRAFLLAAIIDNIGPSPDAEERPAIRFANHQQKFSRDTLGKIVTSTVGRKLDMRLTGDNVLLVWSRHPSFRHTVGAMARALADLCIDRMRIPFRDLIYLHRSTENIVVLVVMDRTIPVRVRDT